MEKQHGEALLPFWSQKRLVYNEYKPGYHLVDSKQNQVQFCILA